MRRFQVTNIPKSGTGPTTSQSPPACPNGFGSDRPAFVLKPFRFHKARCMLKLGRQSSKRRPTLIAFEETHEDLPTVLVIDDDRMVRDVLHDVLESAGLDVQTAEDGHSGLKILLDDQVDLLIVDLEMPGLGGRDIIQELKHRESTLPIIALTSFARAAMGDVLEMGVSRTYVKPFRVKELLEVVEASLAGTG
jgi:CheY-like chemotaxis protein